MMIIYSFVRLLLTRNLYIYYTASFYGADYAVVLPIRPSNSRSGS